MSQCSERVKHALSPPFVSSGLFLVPAPAAAPSGNGAATNPGRPEPENSKATVLPPSSPPGPAPRESSATFMRLHDIIYRMVRTAFCEDQIPHPKSGTGTALPCLALPCPIALPARLQGRLSASLHQKHTKWSQIMHESPQSGRFTGLHCIPCIGGILLCLFFF